MIAKYIVLSNIISVASDNVLRIYIHDPSWYYKKLWYYLILYQDITAYSSAVKFTRLISWNDCLQAEVMPKAMKTLVLIQNHVETII